MQELSNFSKIAQEMELGLNPKSEMAKLTSKLIMPAPKLTC